MTNTTNTPQIGTLRQLKVQPGDVVECVNVGITPEHMTRGKRYHIQSGPVIVTDIGKNWGLGAYAHTGFPTYCEYRIISRAAPHLAETPATKWDAMTDAERVTAVYEGLKGATLYDGADRVKAVLADLGAIKAEPAVETVALCWRDDFGTVENKIGTINLIDGKPDLSSAVLA